MPGMVEIANQSVRRRSEKPSGWRSVGIVLMSIELERWKKAREISSEEGGVAGRGQWWRETWDYNH